jgi:hypothetical protein
MVDRVPESECRPWSHITVHFQAEATVGARFATRTVGRWRVFATGSEDGVTPEGIRVAAARASPAQLG